MIDIAAQFKEVVRQKGFRSITEEWLIFSSKLSISEKQQVAVALSKEHPWIWEPVLDDFLSNHDLELCLPVLDNVIARTGLGIGLHSFRKRCSADVDFANQCISHLNDIESQNSLDLSSIILAYSLSNNVDRWAILTDKLRNHSAKDRYNALLASRILINMKIRPSSDFLKAVYEIGTREMDTRVTRELAWIAVLTYSLVPDGAKKMLCWLLSLCDVSVAYEVLRALSWKNEVPTELRFELLRNLSGVLDQNIEEQIAWCIAEFGHTDVASSMQILREISARNHYSIYGGRAWAFQQLGERQRDKCIEIVKSWVNEKSDNVEKYRLHCFFVPEVLMELTIGNRDTLVSVIEDLSGSNDDLVIATIQEYMKDVPVEQWEPNNPSDQKRLSKCIDILKKIAIRSGKPQERFPKVKEKIFQCGQLIELIRTVERKPQPELVRDGLKQFDSIGRFISVSVDEKLVSESPPFPLFLLLGSDRCDYKEYLERVDSARKEKDQNKQTILIYRSKDSLARFGLLSHLDNCLAAIGETELGTRELRAKLLHEKESEFQSAISEIEVISRLRQQMPLAIAERAPTKEGSTIKRPDIRIEVLGLPIYTEVITPGMAAILRYLGGGGIPNRLVGMILHEFKKHLNDLVDDRHAIIVVDMSHSEIDYFSADSAMSGSLALGLIWDTENRQAVAEYPTRGKDAVSLIDPATRKILGLIVYKRIFTKEGHIALRGRYLPNPFSQEGKKVLVCKVVGEILLDLVD